VVSALSSAVAVAPVAGAVGRRPPAITWVDIGGASATLPILSDRGHVALTQFYGGAPDLEARGYVWFRGVLTELTPDIAPDLASGPAAVNDRGQVAGASVGWEEGTRLFVWEDGAVTWLTEPGQPMTDFPVEIDRRGRVLANRAGRASVFDDGQEIVSPLVLDGMPITARAMNDRGDVVGTAGGHLGPNYLWPVGGEPTLIEAPDRAYVWAVNDGGTVLGSFSAEGRVRQFVWRRGRLTDLGTLGGATLRGGDPTRDHLNGRGQVTGSSETATGAVHAFRWTNGRMRDLGTLGGANSWGHGINDRGDVVGESETASGETHAFLWRDGTMTDLGALTGSPDSGATAINERGQVVGHRDYGSSTVLWETGRR
jgi:probable HAF family extracellular repeat protein